MGTAQANKNTITLRGSTEIVAEFFGYAVNSILYQRGIYDPESFKRVSKYGLTMMLTADEGLDEYLKQVMTQLSDWLVHGSLQKLVLVISSALTNVVMERWAFDIHTDKECVTNGRTHSKSQKEITQEIQAIIRQITASVTFLPLLEEPCSFELLVYTDKEADVPKLWEESDPKFITNSSKVQLRSFTTKVHKVESMVSYRTEDSDED